MEEDTIPIYSCIKCKNNITKDCVSKPLDGHKCVCVDCDETITPKVGANYSELSMVQDIIRRMYNETQMYELYKRLRNRVIYKEAF